MPKRISIWDMDFYNKKSFVPNPIAMKISSFHKQQEHLVNFIEEEFHINISYDIFYIIREKESTPKPPGHLMDDKRVKLIGRTFRFFDNYWKPDAIISAVRPDYMLYPENEKNAYYNANIVQFYHEGKLLLKKQPFENTLKYRKKTLVIDKEFWDVSEKNIISCLQELKEYRDVAFLHPINFKKILNSEEIKNLFIELHFSQGTIFRFRNNFGQEFEDAKIIFDFMDKLKEKHKHVRFTNIPFKAVTVDHWEGSEYGLYDLERCLQIVNEAKKRSIHIRIVSPNNRFNSPFWYYFEILEHWTLYMETMSYVEVMLNSSEKRFGVYWYGILNDKKKWSLPNAHFLLSLMVKKPEWIKEYGLRRWADDFINESMINWNTVMSYKGDLQNNLKKTEEE